MEEGRVFVDQSRLFGCIACGQCMAVCPQDCIEVCGRALKPEDRFELLPPEKRTDYESLLGLLEARRSVRRYRDWPVDRAMIEKILQAAATAPMGIPPSDVRVRVFEGRETVNGFAADFIEFVRKWQWLAEWPFNWLWRVFYGKAMSETLETFALPLFEHLVKCQAEGEDDLLHRAPLAMLFYGGSYNDPADAEVAATYAMLAAEALGLGSCMIGSVAPLLRYSKKLKEKYGLQTDMQGGIMVVFGHPEVQYKRGIRRSFAEVRWK